jgi:hypothetical protein
MLDQKAKDIRKLQEEIAERQVRVKKLREEIDAELESLSGTRRGRPRKENGAGEPAKPAQAGGQ